jgi:hypothetical protein
MVREAGTINSLKLPPLSDQRHCSIWWQFLVHTLLLVLVVVESTLALHSTLAIAATSTITTSDTHPHKLVSKQGIE